jgi:hypothetical protein
VMPVKYNEVLYTGTLFFFYTIVESLIAPA